MTRIIEDSPTAHEAVWEAWQAGESVCLTIPGYPDPTDWVMKQKAPPGLFHYVVSEGGMRLIHVPWDRLAARFDKGNYPEGLFHRTLTLLDNRHAYGLLLGRLYPLYKGWEVIPWDFQFPADLGHRIERLGATCVVCVGDTLRPYISGSTPQRGKTLKGTVNCCRPLSPSLWVELQTFFAGPVYNHWGNKEIGTIAFSRGNKPEENEVGEILVPYKIEAGELWVKAPYAVGNQGWIKTGKLAEIKPERRLFIYGDAE